MNKILEESKRISLVHQRFLNGERLEDFFPTDYPDVELFVLRGTNHQHGNQYVEGAFFNRHLANKVLLRTQLDEKKVAHPYYLISGTAFEISAGGFIDPMMEVPFSPADVHNVYARLEDGMRSSTEELFGAVRGRALSKDPWYSPKRLLSFFRKK